MRNLAYGVDVRARCRSVIHSSFSADAAAGGGAPVIDSRYDLRPSGRAQSIARPHVAAGSQPSPATPLRPARSPCFVARRAAGCGSRPTAAHFQTGILDVQPVQRSERSRSIPPIRRTSGWGSARS